MLQNDLNRPKKRIRIEGPSQKFENAAQIRTALQNGNLENLKEALASLRNQLSLKLQETSVAPQDKRLELTKQWIENSPGVHDLFEIWEKSNTTSLIALVISLLSSILGLLNLHYNNHSLGQPIMKTLLSPSRLRTLNSYVGGANNELIIVTLKLYNVMSGFAGGRDKKAVLEGFGWEIKSLSRLLNMRRKTHGERDTSDPLVRPDIRAHYILLLLSFIDVDSSTPIKALFLEQHREPFLSIFKGMRQDHYSLARKILEVCWGGIWSDVKLRRTIKVSLFNETTLGHIMKLYERAFTEDDDDEHIPANLAHHFLLAICTRPGTGICFKDRGWYTSKVVQDDEDTKDDEDGNKNGKVYNKILANILKTLKVNEDERQQELAIKIVTACPELVSRFWAAAALTLEPRLSSRWMTNISVFGNIISLPIPSSTFFLPNSQLYQPTPPPLSTVIENILPSVNTKHNFSKGLQSTSGLVQHCTALALSRCLVKYRAVVEYFRKIALALKEDVEEGQWSRRCKDLEREVRRRVPEFQVLVAFSQQKQDTKAPANPTKAALLAESAQRLLWLYQHCLPSVVAEARFDVGKLLIVFAAGPSAQSDEAIEPSTRLRRVQKLHILNLLKDSDQFTWNGKIASLSQSPFHILLAALANATSPTVRQALTTLLRVILSRSILFQEDSNEANLWLNVLPRKGQTDVSEPSLFEHEVEGVVSFIDECVQRCLKTPYRYIEVLHAMKGPSNTEAGFSNIDKYPSPLLMTFIEQLDAKINNKSLLPSHTIGIVSYVRKLIVDLTQKMPDLQFLRSYTVEFCSIVREDHLVGEPSALRSSVQRELEILRITLSFGASITSDSTEHNEVETYVAGLESSPIPESENDKTNQIFRLIHWLRTLSSPLGTSFLKRLGIFVVDRRPTLLPLLMEHIIPGQADLWEALDLRSPFSRFHGLIPFRLLYINTSAEQIQDEQCQKTLCDAIFNNNPTAPMLLQIIRFILHFIAAAKEPNAVAGHLFLLGRILQISDSVISRTELQSLKEDVFIRSGTLKSLLMNNPPPGLMKGIQCLLESIDPLSKDDRSLILDITNYWSEVLKTSLNSDVLDKTSNACIWIKYLEPDGLFALLDSFMNCNLGSTLPKTFKAVLEALYLTASLDPNVEFSLVMRLPQLISLRSSIGGLTLLEDAIAIAIQAALPVGIDGCATRPSASNEVDFKTIFTLSEQRWSRYRLSESITVNAKVFLAGPVTSHSTVKIVCGLLYLRQYSPEKICEWLQSLHCQQTSADFFMPILHAFLDVIDPSTTTLLMAAFWSRSASECLNTLTHISTGQDAHTHARHCLVKLLSLTNPQRSINQDIEKQFESLSARDISKELITTGIELWTTMGPIASPFTTILIDRGMQRCIDNYVLEKVTIESDLFTEMLDDLLRLALVAQPYLVETLLSVTIQHRLWNVPALRLCITCLVSCQLKPVVVNRYLQSVIQHSHFFRTCSSSPVEFPKLRESVIELLYSLFTLHPTNTCQLTHIEPLIRVYRGTLSNSDLRILAIFRLFEDHRKLSVAPLLSRWSSAPNTSSQSALESLHSLDPSIVLRTCHHFPSWRHLADETKFGLHQEDSILYDPIFLMLLFSQMLVDKPPATAFGWIELFRTNVISLFIRALSSKDGLLRDLALSQIVALWKQVEQADLQEKPHVLYILNLLKDLMPPVDPLDPSFSLYPRRLPTYTTSLLMHSLRAVFHPSNFIYPITARFLLQRPSLDTTDVPMLYGLLYTSNDENWKKERLWIVKFLADGMTSSEDWRILKRRHTWDLLASLFQSSSSVEDAPLRAAILEVLANLTCNTQATSSLILKSSLLPWIEMQILNPGAQEQGIEWIKVLENILTIVDSVQIEISTNGEWRMIICRCLKHLLDQRITTSARDNFINSVPVVLRLAHLTTTLDGPSLAELPSLLDLCFEHLEFLTTGIKLEDVSLPLRLDKGVGLLPVPLHNSLTVHKSISISDSTPPLYLFQLSCELHELLWQATMLLPRQTPVWNKLTAHLLIFDSFTIGGSVGAAEWARQQVIQNVGQKKFP